MCGIFCSIQSTTTTQNKEYTQRIVSSVSNLLSHRGPDNTNYAVIECKGTDKSIIMVHTRLHIVGDSTPQPLTDDANSIYLIINGEIFNWKELSNELNYTCSKSDCEVLIPLYKKYIREQRNFKKFFSKINGQFSFVLYDALTNYLFVSRDHVGVTPLYYGYDENTVAFSSELKCLTMSNKQDIPVSFVSSVKTFYPRSYMYTDVDNCVHNAITGISTFNYLNYYDTKMNEETSRIIIERNIKLKLEKSVKLQLSELNLENAPEYGVLLSGGLDSSLIASIISKNAVKKVKTFSIGMSKNSADLIASRNVAKFLNTEHYEFYFTAEEGVDALKSVIWYMETYDTTTIRAGTAMYLLTKKIKERFPNLKILFSGELSDELLSYLYGANAPSILDYQLETIKLVSDVHMFDALRANKTCMANSVEVRVPFTDPEFVEYILSIDPKFKIFGKLNNYKTMEKQILRDSFNTVDKNGNAYLPNEVLYRKKEAFSDGVSNHSEGQGVKENWIDSIIEFCDKKYGNLTFLIKKEKYNYNRPSTKEELYYRETFCELFNQNSFTNTSEFTVKFWRPKWCGDNPDPSARKHIVEQFNLGSFEKI